ncbi:hypothetical protein [Sporichthya polymorpha]|uniref:hypothetical protein n=1 Tax=Sporichthya polymorpha TaxID=35751 RepID=UPI00036627C9|nr:hypothetical protein [Sporichthya polymorpha]
MRAGLAVVLLATGAAGAIATTTGSATAAGSYQASAAAQGLRFTISSEAFPVEQSPIDVTAPMAQASSSSVEQQAFASYPYPGSLAAAAPGLIGGLAADQGYPLPFAVPGYPMVANSRCTDDNRTTKVPDTEGAGLPGSLPYTMTSTCGPSSAEAKASSGSSSVQGGVGLTVGHVAAIARAAQDADGLTSAVGTSEATGINVAGGLLQLSGLTATAAATVNPSGTFNPDSTFGIGTISVAGTPVSFGPKGFTSPANSTPVDVSAINAILKNAGIELTWITETRTKTSITSAGLQITMTQQDPQSGLPVITRWVFGQVTASADAQSFDTAAGPATSPVDAATSPGAVPAAPVPGVDAAGAPGLVPSTGVVPGTAPTVNLASPATQVIRTGWFSSGSVLSFYAVLGLAGLALLVSSGLVSPLRKVVPWTR